MASGSLAQSTDALRKIKPKTARGKRFLQNREPKVVEDAKTAVFLKSTRTSPILNEALQDLVSLKKPYAIKLQKKNSIHPFEGGEQEASLEFIAQKNDATFIVLGSHSKKRPNQLTVVRMFDHHILDMLELSIEDYASIQSIRGPLCAVGLKPAFIFSGELFEQRDEYKKLQNIILDLFHGQEVQQMNLSGLESVISVTATEKLILFRVYRIFYKKSGSRVPRVELQLMGPSLDLKIGRTRFASPELLRKALKKPRELMPKKVKNVKTTPLGETVGRVHMGNQKLDTIQTRKVKALKDKSGRTDSN